MFDILIKGGTVIDGTGSPGEVADVGVSDGLIVAIGQLDRPEHSAAKVIDATNMVVCPGFVDPHTHYDAQLLWDPHATPSNIHGVTTAVMGNCGFTLAPVGNEADADYIRHMMVKVEGMPLEALENGFTWDWNTFGEYLDRLEDKVAINVATMVGHCAIRRMVMGDEATAGEASQEQIASMKLLLAESIQAGGLGLSTTRSHTHSDGDGKPVPSRVASEDELLQLCEVVGEHEGTTLEWASSGCLSGFDESEVDLMANMSLRAGRPLNWNVLTIDSGRPDGYRNQLQAIEEVHERGASSIALTMPVLVGMNMSFLTFCGLNLMPDWGPILGLPIDERIEKLRDPDVRRFLEERAASPDAGVFSRLAGWGLYEIGDTFSAENEGLKGAKIADLARERGVRDCYCLLDIVLADDLRTVLWPGPTDDDPASWNMRQSTWRHPQVMIGGSDAGAHLDRMSGAPYTTSWLHDTLHGKQLNTIEEAIHSLTQVPARLFGLRERGEIREGWHADIVVFDPELVNSGDVVMANDLPGGAGRLVADSSGIVRVLVNGVVTVVDGVATNALPGTVLRSGRDTETVSIPATL
ncbi:MAG: amidohydrolase family protein [Acidimicrobiales bacterium]